MFSPESKLHAATGQLKMPDMPGLSPASAPPNPFSGIRRAGQAKRAMNFEKFQNSKNAPGGPSSAGVVNQNQGGKVGSQFGSMGPGTGSNKFS